MAYHVKLGETPQQALRRAGLDQIDRAVRALAATNETDKAIHETRKCLKRIRALLRLVRPGLDASVFQSENARYRDIARLLSRERDADVLSATLLKLQQIASDADAAALTKLMAHFDAAVSHCAPAARDTSIKEASRQLLAAKMVMAKMTVGGHDFDAIETGLRDSYRRGRNLFQMAYSSPSNEAFHEWRKSVQLHWRHMALMSRAWPDMFAARVEAARELSQILGDAQDLSVLIARIEDLPPGALPPAPAKRIVKLAYSRQQQLRELARPRGAQIFCMKPKAMSHAVIEQWSAARAIADMSDVQPASPAVKAISAPAVSAPAVATAGSAKNKRKRTRAPA